MTLFKEQAFLINKLIAISSLVVITLFLSFYIVYNAAWLLGDDVQFLNTTAIGRFIDVREYIFPEMGRFLPLTLWDFNLLHFFPQGETALSHFLLVAVSFVSFTIFSYLFFAEIVKNKLVKNKYTNWLIVCSVVFITARVYSIFLELHYSERIVLVLLSAFLFFTHKFYFEKKWIHGILAILIAVYLVYCKEPISIALLIFVGTPLMINYKALDKKILKFSLILIFNSLIYLVLYYFLSFRHSTFLYTGGNMVSPIGDLTYGVFRSHKLLICAFVFAFFRLFAILIRKDRTQVFFDGMLFSGIVYSMVLIVLGLNYSYYYFPALILTFPAILNWATQIISIKWLTGLLCVSALYVFYMTFPDIKRNQQNRIQTFQEMNAIAEFEKQGYLLLWNQPELGKNNHLEEIIRDWRKKCLEQYLQFLLQKSISLDPIENIMIKENGIKEKAILFNPCENEVVDGAESEKYSLPKSRWILLTNLNGIKIFENNPL